jgi:hypothetical protein
MSTTSANHALHLTRPSRSGCNPTSTRAGSLSLGRSAASDTSVLSPCPRCLCGYFFSPQRHRGHREFCGSVPAGREFLFVYFAWFVVSFSAQ